MTPVRVEQVPPALDAKSYYADETRIPRCALLDSPQGDPNRTLIDDLEWLDGLMITALWRLYLLADGSISSLRYRGDKRARGDQGPALHPSRVPESSGARDIDHLWSQYNAARTHRARFAWILEAQHLARSMSHSPDRSLRRDTLEWRERIANDPRSPRECEHIYGVSYRTIYRIRKRAAS